MSNDDAPTIGKPKLLSDSRVYLSGPMDFVASREEERAHGWRARVGQVLCAMGVVVFDPWFKPDVLGLHEYGREGVNTADDRARWRFGKDKVEVRAELVDKYWQTMHIDLRMVDTADFIVCYCPTNVYSVGTPHELVVAREQHKPVLFVSPPVEFPSLDRLREHLAGDGEGTKLLEDLVREGPIRPNPYGIPSLWYMPLIGADSFFDGFGFAGYRDQFDWPETDLDRRESTRPPKRPLLPYLIELNEKLPQRWNHGRGAYEPDDDWILWDFASIGEEPGALVEQVYHAGDPTGAGERA